MNIHSLICLAVLLAAPLLRADPLDDLARDFWAWRAIQQPVSDDDVNRIERPSDWLPDWSPAAVARYRGQLTEFESRWKKLGASAWPVPRQVDYRLMGSALARVRWELEFTRNWQRNPEFYIDQTLGAYFELLLPPPPFDAERTRHIVAILNSIPHTLEDAKKSLARVPAPFARLALVDLQDIRPRLLKSVQELKPYLDASAAAGLDAAADRAAIALESYRDWLNQRLPTMTAQTSIGREGYIFFLKNVALIPFSPEQMLSMGIRNGRVRLPRRRMKSITISECLC